MIKYIHVNPLLKHEKFYVSFLRNMRKFIRFNFSSIKLRNFATDFFSLMYDLTAKYSAEVVDP